MIKLEEVIQKPTDRAEAKKQAIECIKERHPLIVVNRFSDERPEDGLVKLINEKVFNEEINQGFIEGCQHVYGEVSEWITNKNRNPEDSVSKFYDALFTVVENTGRDEFRVMSRELLRYSIETNLVENDFHLAYNILSMNRSFKFKEDEFVHVNYFLSNEKTAASAFQILINDYKEKKEFIINSLYKLACNKYDGGWKIDCGFLLVYAKEKIGNEFIRDIKNHLAKNGRKYIFDSISEDLKNAGINI